MTALPPPSMPGCQCRYRSPRCHPGITPERPRNAPVAIPSSGPACRRQFHQLPPTAHKPPHQLGTGRNGMPGGLAGTADSSSGSARAPTLLSCGQGIGETDAPARAPPSPASLGADGSPRLIWINCSNPRIPAGPLLTAARFACSFRNSCTPFMVTVPTWSTQPHPTGSDAPASPDAV